MPTRKCIYCVLVECGVFKSAETHAFNSSSGTGSADYLQGRRTGICGWHYSDIGPSTGGRAFPKDRSQGLQSVAPPAQCPKTNHWRQVCIKAWAERHFIHALATRRYALLSNAPQRKLLGAAWQTLFRSVEGGQALFMFDILFVCLHASVTLLSSFRNQG